MHETQQELRAILNAADMLLRGVILEVDRIANTPAQGWTYETRRNAMQGLRQTASEVLDAFGEWMQKNVWIKSIVEITQCLDSIKSTAHGAAFGGSRTWGRTALKQDVQRLKELFGAGCECEMEIRAQNGSDNEPAKVLKYELQAARSKLPEYMSVDEVAAFFNVSRRTVVRHFENYPGVIDLNRGQEHDGRRYRFLRIPRGALNRFTDQRRVRR